MNNATDNFTKSTARRTGIVGAGLMGRWHAHCISRTGAPLVAVADPDLGRAAAVGKRHGAAVRRSLDEMLDADVIDILHICTATPTHEEMIRKALGRNVHVFVEKPLAETAERSEILCELATEANRRLCPVHQYAFQRSIEHILAWRARAGRPSHVEMAFHSAGADHLAGANHALVAADILPHPISILQRLFPIETLDGAVWEIVPAGPSGWEIMTQIEDAFVRISISLSTRPTTAAFKLRGDQGTYVADLFHDFAMFQDGTVSRQSKILRPFRDSTAQLARASVNMAARIIRREPAYPGLVQLVSGFQAACAGRAPVPIDARQIVGVGRARDHFLHAVGAASKPKAAQ